MVRRPRYGLALTLGRCALPVLLIILTMLLVLLLVPHMTAAAANGLPPRPDPPLPDPPLPDPSPTPALRHSSGAYIRLNVTPPMAPPMAGDAAPPKVWTLVQWEDAVGAWHDVGSWSGHLDDARAGTKTWWVNAADYGRGAFRWAVLQDKDGSVLAVSAPFHLPTSNGQVLDVGVTLP